MVQESICAGFPSPAGDYLDEPINLETELIRNKPATFLWRVIGHSMKDAGIYSGDILVIDRSLKPQNGDIVIAVVNGERSLKRLKYIKGRPHLAFDNREFPEFNTSDESDIEIWGVVRCNIHMLVQR